MKQTNRKLSVPRVADPHTERALRDMVLAIQSQNREYRAHCEVVGTELANWRRIQIRVRDKEGAPLTGRFLVLCWITKATDSTISNYGAPPDADNDPASLVVDFDLFPNAQGLEKLGAGNRTFLVTTDENGQVAVKIQCAAAQKNYYFHVAALGLVDVAQIDFG